MKHSLILVDVEIESPGDVVSRRSFADARRIGRVAGTAAAAVGIHAISFHLEIKQQLIVSLARNGVRVIVKVSGRTDIQQSTMQLALDAASQPIDNEKLKYRQPFSKIIPVTRDNVIASSRIGLQYVRRCPLRIG
jgi:hypothetical protein